MRAFSCRSRSSARARAFASLVSATRGRFRAASRSARVGVARPLPVVGVLGASCAAESAEVFRAPVADLLDPAHRGVTAIRRDGQEWRGPAFLLPGAGRERLVWGFTGMLLDALFDRLGWTEPWDDERELPLVLPPDASD